MNKQLRAKSAHIRPTGFPFYTQTTKGKDLQKFSTTASLIITKATVTIEAGQKLNYSTDQFSKLTTSKN